MKRSTSSKLRSTFSKLLRKPSGRSGKHNRQEQLTSSKVVPIASSSDAQTNGDAVYDAVAEWKTGPLQHHPGMNDAEVASHLDAMGWEQASPGRNQTAQYWQFTPQQNGLEAASSASEHSIEPDDAFGPPSQLQTPAKGPELQGSATRQHTPLTAEAPNPKMRRSDSQQLDHAHSMVNGNARTHTDGDATDPVAAQRQLAPQQQQLGQQRQPTPEIVPLRESSLPSHEKRSAARPELLSRPPSAAWDAAATAPHDSLAPASPERQSSMPPGAAVTTPGKLTLKDQAAATYPSQAAPGVGVEGVGQPAGLTTMHSLGSFQEVVPAPPVPSQNRGPSPFERQSDKLAPPTPWSNTEPQQKPPLPSPRRPPAPPSPYNRTSQKLQQTNPFKGRSTMRNRYGSQASPQRSRSGPPGSPVSHLDNMASVPSSAQLGSTSPASISRLSRHNSGRSYQGPLDGDHASPSRLNRQHSSRSYQGAPLDGDHASPMRGGLEQMQTAVSLASSGRQLDPAGPGYSHQDSRPGTAGSSRSGRNPGSRSRMGSAASAWLESQSAHQLAANVKSLAAEVVHAKSKQAKELAVLKLYAVLSQAHFVKQQAADWEGAFLGILALPLPLLLTHLSHMLITTEATFSHMVKGMAAATLKSIAVWVEGQVQGPGPCQGLVQQVLGQLVQESNPHLGQLSQQGPSLQDEEPWNDSLLPTRQSMFGSGITGTQLLDTEALDGLLDDDFTSMQSGGHSMLRRGVLDTSGLLGSSVLDSGAWPVKRQLPAGNCSPSLAPSVLTTGASCMVLNSQEVAEYVRSHPKGLRATFWLFKTDQEDAWYAAASLVGSMASLGEPYIDAMGGANLVKPLFVVLKGKSLACRGAALKALHQLTLDSACRAVIARQDSYLQALVRAVQQGEADLQQPAVQILACLIAQDPSTHYICAEAGLVEALGKLLKRGNSAALVLQAVSEALKHLTASSQTNRNSLVACGILPFVVEGLSSGDEGVQYNMARTLRHLALGSQPAHKDAAMPAIVPLTQALQMGRPRVQFACASALAMLLEGHPQACPLVQSNGGIAALASMLHQAGAQAKKAAAEALQALAAEDVNMKPEIAKSGALGPLVQMTKTGSLQQRAAAAGALQALAYCPGRLDIAAGIAAEGGIQPLVAMASQGPLPLRSAAAGALCNLALASPHNQAAIVEAGAIPALIEVVEQAQPDGQYAAAAALYNLAGRDREVRLAIMRCNAVPALVQMLHADSWYCRIVAAEVFGRLTAEWGNREAMEGAGAVTPLIHLLHLKHSPGMLDSVEGPVHHVAYERGQDVIMMKGYKFAKAKTAAAAMLGCLALANPATAAQLFQAGVAEELLGMLESSSAQARAIACACLGDLAQAHPPLQLYLSQGSRLSRLVRTMKQGVGARGAPQPDVGAAAAALGVLVAHQPLARGALLQQGGLPCLMALLQQGSLAEQSIAANVLFDMSEESGEARRQVEEGGLLGEVHHLVASTNPPAVAAGGATAALLQATAHLPYAGFAVTAKPSVNLLVLLQIPFEELGPARSSRLPSGALPAALPLPLRRAISRPLPDEAPQPLPRRTASRTLLPQDPIDVGSGQGQQPHQQEEGSSFRFASWSGSLPGSVLNLPHSAPNEPTRQNSRQEQWALPNRSEYPAQQHILDTYIG